MKNKFFCAKPALAICFFFFSIGSAFSQTLQPGVTKVAAQYVCLPCGYDCDTTIHKEPGTCSQCDMQLVEKTTVTFQSIQPSELCDFIKAHPEVVLLDVRTKEEYEGKSNPNFGSLKNAINIPIAELEKRLPGIDSLQDKEIIVYCSHSHRSPRASYLLTQKGFTRVINLAGGMSMLKDNACKK